ncbi:EAL domain-containing response regulator [Arenimonas terrae]|uniref:EAL domain-containing protein n=1 Tax=Arenimonas terrae TaxID=2546226 RepID=A0A5C4RQH9_9GAMM|nr:EAL domain-containing response regulator [Arenimonas terrae]TNJ33288.1 EAL domain-containing protein [Arenimonas terrae]
MSLAGLSILLVEDHGFQRRLGLRLLADLGLTQLHEAADGFQALDLLRALPGPPDVVLVDLDMPGMDGVEFIGIVAQERLARSIAVVSAMEPALLHTVQVMAKASGLRVLGCIEKPLTPGKLTTVLSLFETEAGAGHVVSDVEVSLDEARTALARGEIVPWFQPQAEFGNGKIIGVEALARWRLADGQMVPPAVFVPVMEAGGLIDELTSLMLVQSCAWWKRWQARGLDLKISVNVSAHNLTGPEVADRYEAVLREHGLSPEQVILEITESSVMSDTARGLGMLARLRLKGFGLSVDDFGTGYSSLSQLSQIPFTELKIDRGFVSGAPGQPRKRAMIETSLDLARKLDLKVVAEGVETIEEWQLLAGLGCDFAQGYLISPPVPGEQLPDAIQRWRQTHH